MTARLDPNGDEGDATMQRRHRKPSFAKSGKDQTDLGWEESARKTRWICCFEHNRSLSFSPIPLPKKQKKKEENADTQTPFLAPCKVPEQYSNPQCPLQQVSGVFRIPTIQGWQGLPLPVRPTIQGWQVFPESESSQVDVEREATRRTEEAEIRRPLSPLRHGQLRLLVHGRVQKELVPFTQRPPRSGLPLERSLSAVPRPCY